LYCLTADIDPTAHVLEGSVTLVRALAGDCSLDGKVQFSDYLTVEQNFGKSNRSWSDGDFNGDGRVNFADYLLLEANFGKTISEPASLSLLALGGLSMLRRRR
jgi:hypothetical protein